jgi:hypothetical protein
VYGGRVSSPKVLGRLASIPVSGGIIGGEKAWQMFVPVVNLIRKLESKCPELLFNGSDSTFCDAIGLWPVRRDMAEVNTILGAECSHLH